MESTTIFRTEAQKSFQRVFRTLCHQRKKVEVWSDFVTLLSYGLANNCEPNEGIRNARLRKCHQIADKYIGEEKMGIISLCSITAAALNKDDHQDFLGELFMCLGLGDTWNGQCFTPWDAACQAASMLFIESSTCNTGRPFVSIFDQCCGAGSLLLAAAANYSDSANGSHRKSDILLVGQDVDDIAAKMCHIQLSILGYAGYVAIANALTNPIEGPVLTPKMQSPCELLFTPAYYSSLWEFRRARILMQQITETPREPTDNT